jgi:hypothetical protein
MKAEQDWGWRSILYRHAGERGYLLYWLENVREGNPEALAHTRWK